MSVAIDGVSIRCTTDLAREIHQFRNNNFAATIRRRCCAGCRYCSNRAPPDTIAPTLDSRRLRRSFDASDAREMPTGLLARVGSERSGPMPCLSNERRTSSARGHVGPRRDRCGGKRCAGERAREARIDPPRSWRRPTYVAQTDSLRRAPEAERERQRDGDGALSRSDDAPQLHTFSQRDLTLRDAAGLTAAQRSVTVSALNVEATATG